MALGCVLIVLNALYFLRGTRGGGNLRVTVDVSASGADGALGDDAALVKLPPLERIRAELGGVGLPVPHEAGFLKKENIPALSISSGDPNNAALVGKLAGELGRIQVAANKGWNVSSPKVQPLGQLGYVKRDLPVYKDGFQRLDIAVLGRPKTGLFTVEQLQSNTYTSILCLSFNTDHCFDPTQYIAIGETRKVNRIQNLRDTVWSKHKFCKTMSDATKGLTDRDLLSFTFPCWVMPGGYEKMLRYSRDNDIQTWIAKPRSLGAGMGIYIVSDLSSLEHEKSTSNVVQTYLENPHLIEKPGLDGVVSKFKWDARTYVLVTSVTPLRAYVFNRGLVRISTSPYTKDCKTNVTACLTNTSLNKKVEGAQLKDITWSFHKLKEYLASRNEDDWDTVFLRIQRAIGLTLLSSESTLLKHFVPRGFRCKCCYQLLGVDVIFDDELQPKVVEINGEPNLKTTSNGKTHYDFTKKYMARDLTALVFNTQSQHLKAAQRLVSWANAVVRESNKKSGSVVLGQDHAEFVLQTLREHAKLGGFRPVYPNDDLAEPHGRFLRFLRDKEAAAGSSDDPLVHADGRRYRLHQVITTVLNTKALAQTATMDAPSASSTDLLESGSKPVETDDGAAPGQALSKRRKRGPASSPGDSEDEF